MRYRQHAAGASHTIDTTIVVRGETHLRAHRVTLAPGTSGVGGIEGSAPLGYSTGAQPEIRGDAEGGWEYAAGDRAVAIVRLRGYSGQLAAGAWRGRPDLNSVYPEHLLPLLLMERLNPAHELVCLVHTGRPLAEPAALGSMLREVRWEKGGALHVVWKDGAVVHVPPCNKVGRRSAFCHGGR